MEKINNAFNSFHTYKGLKGFERDYIERRIVKVVKKTGPNEHDYILVDKIIESKTPIKDVVMADKDNCGVYNIIKTLIRENGEPYVNDIINRKVEISDEICDISDMPTDLMGALDKVQNIKEIYETLPKELTNGKDIVSFFKDYKGEDLKKYYAKKVNEIISRDKNLNKKIEKKVEKKVEDIKKENK